MRACGTSRDAMNSQSENADGLDALRQEAIVWVVLLTSGKATRADAQRLQDWRRRSTAHEEAFRFATRIWRATGDAADPARGDRGAADPARRRFLTGAALATGGALAAGWAGVSIGLLPSPSDLLSDHYTAVGQQKRITLADGSTVDLDAASTLDEAISAQGRRLDLGRGAALFDVAPDDRLLEVTAGPGAVRAHGGRFSIAEGPDDTRVFCLAGRIEVACGSTVALAAGETASFSTAGRLSPVTRGDADTAAPWTRGLLIFEDRPLRAVAADINRHRRGRIILAQGGEREVNAVFRIDRIEEAVPHLAASLKLRSLALPGGIVVLS